MLKNISKWKKAPVWNKLNFSKLEKFGLNI